MSEEGTLVLAAGKGTRMRSSLPKVLHRLAGKPMLSRILDMLDQAGFPCPTVVVGYGADLIRQTVGPRCGYVDQGEQLGTGHAARLGLDALSASVERVVLIHGDEPMIDAETVRAMLDLQHDTGAALVLLTTRVRDTRGFGRVIRNGAGEPVALRQEAELTPEQRAIDEVNLGLYVFDASFLRRQLPALQPHPPKGELYLTDVVERAIDEGRHIAALTLPGGEDLMGINDLVHLEEANRLIYRRVNRRLMESGVTILDSASTFIEEEVQIEPDTVIYPYTMIEGLTRIDGACTIGPNTRIRASRIGRQCQVEASTVEESVVEDEVRIGPYAHLRPGAHVGTRCEIGNYAEIKGSTLGPGSRMHHMSYLGDALVGANVNIGAGTITCNYDGFRKHRTVIEDGAFIGSDTMLRAPVTVGRGASTGAGSVVTHDVESGKLVAGVPARLMGDAPKRDQSESGSETRERSA